MMGETPSDRPLGDAITFDALPGLSTSEIRRRAPTSAVRFVTTDSAKNSYMADEF